MKYSQGMLDFLVWRGPAREGEVIPGIGRVYLPNPLSLTRGSKGEKDTDASLRLHFISILDAVEAMKYPNVQTITVATAEQDFDSITRAYAVQPITYTLKAKPRNLIPSPIYTCHSWKSLPKDVRAQDLEDMIFVGGGFTKHGVICEYDVSYFSVCHGEKKLLEVDTEKQLRMIGGIRY